MKSLHLLLPFLLSVLMSTSGSAQIGVSSVEMTTVRAGKFEKKNLDKLQSSTMIYVVRQSEVERIDELQEVYSEVWNFCPIKVIAPNELQNFIGKDGYSYLTFDGFTRTSSNSSNTYYYLHLWMPDDETKEVKKKKVDQESQLTFARIELFPAFSTYSGVGRGSDVDRLTYMYSEKADFRNWYPGFMKCYLQIVSDRLEKGETRWLYKRVESSRKTVALKENILYVPEYVRIKMNKFTGSEDKKVDGEKLLKKYGYKYKILPAEEISDMILKAKDPIYFMIYVKSSTEKHINVFNSKTCELLYSRYKPMSYNIGKKDFGKISK